MVQDHTSPICRSDFLGGSLAKGNGCLHVSPLFLVHLTVWVKQRLPLTPCCPVWSPLLNPMHTQSHQNHEAMPTPTRTALGTQWPSFLHIQDKTAGSPIALTDHRWDTMTPVTSPCLSIQDKTVGSPTAPTGHRWDIMTPVTSPCIHDRYRPRSEVEQPHF